MNFCKDCRHLVATPPQPGQVIGAADAPIGECRRNPPQVTVVLIGRTIAPISAYPPIQRDYGCHAGFAPKVNA